MEVNDIILYLEVDISWISQKTLRDYKVKPCKTQTLLTNPTPAFASL